MAQQTFSGVPGEFTAGEVLSSSDQNLLRDFLIATIKEGMTGDTGEILPMIMDLTNNRIVLDSGGLEFSDGSTQTVAAAGMTWSGSTANGIGTYGSSSSIVAESTATYNGTTLQLTTSGGGLKLDGLNSSDVNTLDDYEEGTWQATCETGSGSITVNTSYDDGAYVKIGRAVFISGSFAISAISSPSGTLKLLGLPFPVGDLSVNAERSIINTSLFFTNGNMNGPAQGQTAAGQSYIAIDNLNGRAARQEAAAFIDTGSSINVGGWYYANA
jgi:hypothetical protein